ncbi:MAG: Autophagy protein 22 [Geoglossum simile]|nr:MAG: Autophagy protein 22 [Geoglossum simile]
MNPSNSNSVPNTQRPPPPRLASANTKASLVSPSPSCEADDERSLSETSMEFGLSGSRGAPQYPGEDTRYTSKKELAGWYGYGWAAEVFVVCGIGSFIPITLEQLARERGVLLSDRVTPCSPNLGVGSGNGTSVPAALFPRVPEPRECVVYILGMEINTASFAMYTFSLSVLIQALIIISMSGAADHGKYRKSFLLSFAFTGAVATMLFLPIVPSIYLLGALLAIISNTCFGASFVLLNSFLPVMVRHHPAAQFGSESGLGISASPPFEPSDSDTPVGAEEGENTEQRLADSRAALLPGNSNPSPTFQRGRKEIPTSVELQISTQISSYGIGIGYIAAVLVQTASIFIILLTGSTTFSLRLVLFVIGLWWLIFSVPAALWLRPRPGPPLPGTSSGKDRTWVGYFTYAWKSLGKTLLRARHLKDVILFLTAWFLVSDAIATVSGTAVLFAKTQLDMKPAALALINVVATLFGVLGAFTWARISQWLGLRPIQTILACICLFEIIPLYGLLGYLPFIQGLGVVGLQQPWEMYPLGAVYGFVLGGLSSYCRSLFGELIPPGSEAAFYALYAITDKGSSVFGPAIVGMITDRTGGIRPAFWFLAVLVGVPGPILYFVDVERGKRDGAELARELEGRKAEDERRRERDVNGQAPEEARVLLAAEDEDELDRVF